MWLLLAACAHEPLAAVSGELIGADVLWFDLEGTDRIDLIEACFETCPHDELDRPVASLTSWLVDWNWTRSVVEPCEVVAPTVLVDVTVTLPRWQPPPDADPELADEWKTYLLALQRHEEGHVALVHELADGAGSALGRAGCEGAHDAGRAVIDQIRSAQREYDTRTENGRLQGASFWGI